MTDGQLSEASLLAELPENEPNSGHSVNKHKAMSLKIMRSCGRASSSGATAGCMKNT